MQPRKGDDPLPPAREDSGPEAAGFVKSYLRRSFEVFLYWMPVWVPLILLAQIGTLGLEPAIEEEQRLLEHERVLLERLAADEARAQELGAWHEAMGDDIFRERLRRLLQAETRREVEERNLELRAPEPSPDPEEAADGR